MTPVWRIDRRIEICERLEMPVSAGLALLVAAIYVIDRYRERVIATYSWTIPALIVFCVCKLGFAWWRTRLEHARRVALDPSADTMLPTATARGEVRATSARSVFEPPAPVPPADPAEGPRFLG